MNSDGRMIIKLWFKILF